MRSHCNAERQRISDEQTTTNDEVDWLLQAMPTPLDWARMLGRAPWPPKRKRGRPCKHPDLPRSPYRKSERWFAARNRASLVNASKFTSAYSRLRGAY